MVFKERPRASLCLYPHQNAGYPCAPAAGCKNRDDAGVDLVPDAGSGTSHGAGP